MVEYGYDAWGNLLFTSGSMAGTLGADNPFRYRGYYYDDETELYCLNSRYYSPEWSRFINADKRLNTSLGVRGTNLFAYCLNNPTNKADQSGSKPGDLFNTMDEAAKDMAICFNAQSIEEDLEYASFIYSVTAKEIRYGWLTEEYFLNFSSSKGFFVDCRPVHYRYSYMVRVTKYSYVTPNKGNAHSVTIPINWFGTKKKTADIHTHGAYSPEIGGGNDVYSPADLETTIISYLITPLGTVRKYDPSDGSDIELFNDVPFDPNHPSR